MTSIKHLPKLSLKTAMKLFELRITPTITKENLAAIEKSKSEISKKSPIRFKVYAIMTRVRPHLIKELQKQKRKNIAHLLLNRRNDEHRMDKSWIRLETLDDTIRCAWLPPPHLQ